MKVAALFVEKGGAYYGIDDCDPWDIDRDARKYDGPHPVIAHPPCHLWVNLAAVNWKRYGKQKPAWYEGGSDGGCFEHALKCVREFGGVLEHPANSHAWEAHGLQRPIGFGWDSTGLDGGWVCEVWQSAYGHGARKRTWLYYVGTCPAPMRDARPPGTHQIGWFDRNKPTLNKREANATPPLFRDALLALARHSRTGALWRSQPHPATSSPGPMTTGTTSPPPSTPSTPRPANTRASTSGRRRSRGL